MKKLLAVMMALGIMAAGGSTVFAASACPNYCGTQAGKGQTKTFVCQNPDCVNYGEEVVRGENCAYRLSQDGNRIYCRNAECPNGGVCDGTGRIGGKGQRGYHGGR